MNKKDLENNGVIIFNILHQKRFIRVFKIDNDYYEADYLRLTFKKINKKRLDILKNEKIAMLEAKNMTYKAVIKANERLIAKNEEEIKNIKNN